MIKLSFHQLIGVAIDEEYPWIDHLYINQQTAELDDQKYSLCKAFITLRKADKDHSHVNLNQKNDIEFSEDVLIDKHYGVRLELKDPLHLVMTVNQQCNEWLVLCIQLLLLEVGATLVHGAAFEKGGRSFVLASEAQTGKTVIALDLMQRQGWRMLGDDLVVLSNQTIYSFFKEIFIYPIHVYLNDDLLSEHKKSIHHGKILTAFIKKVVPLIKRSLRKFPHLLAFARAHNPQAKKISPKQLLEKDRLCEYIPLGSTIWLARSNQENSQFERWEAPLLAKEMAKSLLKEIYIERIPKQKGNKLSAMLDYETLSQLTYQNMLSACEPQDSYRLTIPEFTPVEELGCIVVDSFDAWGHNSDF
jgi:hypothetical protein